MPMTLAEFQILHELASNLTSIDDKIVLYSLRMINDILSKSDITWCFIADEFRRNCRCVYSLIRSIDDDTGKTGEPFYIGEGYENRPKSHEQHAKCARRFGKQLTRKDKLILHTLDLGIEIEYHFLIVNLSKRESTSIEIALIEQIGRYPKGPLLNTSPGGHLLDGEALVRRNAAVKEALNKPATKELQKRRMREALADPDVLVRHIASAKRGAANRDKSEHSRLTSEGTKRAMAIPAIRDKQLAGLRTPEAHVKMSKSQSNRIRSPHSPEARKNISAGVKLAILKRKNADNVESS